MRFDGKHVAIAGMGVSGISLGVAVKRLGGDAVVLDQKPNDAPAVMRAVDQLDAEGIAAVTGWHGRLDPSEFDLLVVSPGFPQNHPAIRDMQNAGREVWSEVEFAYRISKAPILAITGTNGKSTTTAMLWSILQSMTGSAVLCGNIAGSGFDERTLTAAALEAEPSNYLVAEISSYQLEWTRQFMPRVAAITNITPDHMDRYARFEDYAETKLQLFAQMGPGDSIVVNEEEPSLPIERVVAAAGVGAQIVPFRPSEGLRNGGLALGGRVLAVKDLPFFGDHNMVNALMAWAMASQMVELDDRAVEAVQTFRGLANRMETLGERDGVLVVNNSMCTNPAAVVASSRGVSRPQHLLMGGVTKNLDFSPVGEYLRRADHKVYIFGPEPEQMNRMLGHNWPVFGTMEDAFLAATRQAKPGDAILLSPGCASAEPYANFKERGEAFRAMAIQWISRTN